MIFTKLWYHQDNSDTFRNEVSSMTDNTYLTECYDKSMWEGEGVKCYNKTLWEGEGVLLLLHFEHKHVLLVILGMAADIP